jgi:hypothetical protein
LRAPERLLALELSWSLGRKLMRSLLHRSEWSQLVRIDPSSSLGPFLTGSISSMGPRAPEDDLFASGLL